MNDVPSSNYKGFDIYPLIYKCDPPREWYERRHDRTYNVSAVICNGGADPAGDSARVYPLPADQWENMGNATRAAILGSHGQRLGGGRSRTECPDADR